METYLIPLVITMEAPTPQEVLEVIEALRTLIRNTSTSTGFYADPTSVAPWDEFPGTPLVLTMFVQDQRTESNKESYGPGYVIEAAIAALDKSGDIRLMTDEERYVRRV